jgi:S1-C subfamily serine protease
MFFLNRCILILLLAGAFFGGASRARCSLPSADEQPSLKQRLSRTPDAPALPARRRIFGIGVGFERASSALGVPLSQVLPGSPAARAGLVAGAIIAEINGISTIARSEEECVRIIRESGPAVKLKYYEPSTLKPRTLTITKESIPLPN